MIAVVPIRSGSKGIVDKNIRPIAGNPLFFWTLDALQWSNVDRIIVAVDLPYVDYINQYKFSKYIWDRDQFEWVRSTEKRMFQGQIVDNIQ